MKRLKSIGLGKSSKTDSSAKVSAQPPSANWPQVSPNSQHLASNGTQPQNPPADTYVNFSDDEIRAMEESALEYAIQQSQQQTESSAQETPGHAGQILAQPSQPPQQPVAAPQQPSARSSQPAVQSQAVEQPQWVEQPSLQGQTHSPFQANAQPLPETKKKGKLMQRLGLKKQGSKSLATASSNPTPNPSNPYPMAAGGHHPGRPDPYSHAQASQQFQQQAYAGSPGAHDEQAALAAAVAASELTDQESGRLSEHRSAGEEREEQAMVDLAIKESQVQAEYDNILREAKLLRMDLQHALTKCLEHRVNVQQEHSELSELMGDFGLDNAKGKGIAADHAIEQQFVQSEYDLKQANERVTAVNDAIHELQNLESFIRTTKPPADEAEMLTEEIIRQLLEKLNFLRLDFAPPKEQPPVPNYSSVNIVNRFREQQGSSASVAEPPKPPQTPAKPPPAPPVEEELQELHIQPESSTMGTALNPFEDEEAPRPIFVAASSSSSLFSHDSQNLTEHAPEPHFPPQHQTPAPAVEEKPTNSDLGQSHEQEVLVTPLATPRPEPHITTPAAMPPSVPSRSPSVNSTPSPRVLNRFDSRSSNESGGGNAVAMSQSKEQSRQLLEKASQKLASLLVNANDKNFDATRKPGDPAIRRAPQVVHLYQELRKVMGDDFMIQDLSSQDPKVSLLPGGRYYQALSPADEQARQRALAESASAVQAAKADADRHARMLTKLGAQISSAKLRSMEDVLPLVQEADQQLAVLRADDGLTVSQFEAWPKTRLDVLGEAAGQFSELNYLQAKYQKWMLQQVKVP